MTVNAVERIFWEFDNDPRRVEDFRADPDRYLDVYKLDPQERQAIKDVNLKYLADSGVNSQLTLAVWPLLMGPENHPLPYIKHMNEGKMPGPPDAS